MTESLLEKQPRRPSLKSNMLKSFIEKRRASHSLPRPTMGELMSIKDRKLISSYSEFEDAICYSRAVVADNWIEVSGTTGFVQILSLGTLMHIIQYSISFSFKAQSQF